MNKGNTIEEVDFFRAAQTLEAQKTTTREKLEAEFYKYLEENKKEFNVVFNEEGEVLKGSGGRSQEAKLNKTIKAIIKSPEFTEEDEEFLQEVLRLLKEGGIAKATIKRVLKEIEREINPLKILARVKSGIPSEFFQGTFIKNAADTSGPKEVILSEYLVKGN